MRVLGIDTATWRAAVGLWEDGAAVVDQERQTTGNHAVSLLAMIDTLLAQAGWSIDDLSAVAVSAGPGSFTGLRVGLSTAKGLAFARGIDLVAVPTLEALASTVGSDYPQVTPILDARKDELYVASFRAAPAGADPSRLLRQVDDCLLPLDRLFERVPHPGAVLGDAVLRYGERFAAHWGQAATVLPFETFGPRGSAVAALGARQLASGGAAPLATIEPFYIRPSEAETKRS